MFPDPDGLWRLHAAPSALFGRPSYFDLHDVCAIEVAFVFEERDRDTSAYPRLPVSDECSDAQSEPRSEQAGVERTA